MPVVRIQFLDEIQVVLHEEAWQQAPAAKMRVAAGTTLRIAIPADVDVAVCFKQLEDSSLEIEWYRADLPKQE